MSPVEWSHRFLERSGGSFDDAIRVCEQFTDEYYKNGSVTVRRDPKYVGFFRSAGGYIRRLKAKLK